MKPTLSLLLLVFLLSCKKAGETIQDRIVGKWELRRSLGGWAGTINYPSGNGNIIEFTEITYSRYSNGQIDESGSYTIIKDTARSNNLENRIIYNGVMSPPKTFVSIIDNKLNFSLNMIDAGGGEFERIK